MTTQEGKTLYFGLLSIRFLTSSSLSNNVGWVPRLLINWSHFEMKSVFLFENAFLIKALSCTSPKPASTEYLSASNSYLLRIEFLKSFNGMFRVTEKSQIYIAREAKYDFCENPNAVKKPGCVYIKGKMAAKITTTKTSNIDCQKI